VLLGADLREELAGLRFKSVRVKGNAPAPGTKDIQVELEATGMAFECPACK
jgi:hypothetical protein